jgi:hypothetical protein
MKSGHRNLFIGPMSKNIVDAVIEHNSDSEFQFGLIPSRRQVETSKLGGGYVNSWTTESFSNYVGQTLVLRDHAGPGQGLLEDDGKVSLQSDIESGIKFIHIDPWKKATSISSAADMTIEMIRLCNSDGCMFEIGTESAIYPYSVEQLAKFLQLVRSSLGSLFSKVTYCVTQSGTIVRETENKGIFDADRSAKMCEVIHDFGLLAKEHNSDYLDENDFLVRSNSGVDSFNIAPEFGVNETRKLIELLQSSDRMLEAFIEASFRSNKWKKWVDENPSRIKATEICGHYLFSSKEVVSLKKNLSQLLGFDVDVVLKNEAKQKLRSLENMRIWK